MTRPTYDLTPCSTRSSLRQMLSVGQILSGKIENLGSRGEGFFHVCQDQVFVAKTAPGDEVEVQVYANSGHRYFAQLIRHIKFGNAHRPPKCQHFYECGGCDFQNISYEDQLEWKKKISAHWISRSPLQKFTENLEIDLIRSPREFGYRHRARLQVKNSEPAFLKARSHERIEIKECPILVDGFFRAIQQISSEKKEDKDLSLLYLNGSLQEKSTYFLDTYEIPVHRESFSQANLEVNELMWNRIREDAERSPSKNLALDLFCGSGNFSFGLKKYFQKLIGIESNPLSIRMAREARSDIEWICGRVEFELEKILKNEPQINFVLLDPAREGALQSAQLLALSKVERITYVSCQLDTLIRDLTALVKKGPFRIDRWACVDLMPQTKHIESIVSLSRK